MLPQITKKRVAAYARVSTHDEDQLDSLSAQRSHYETLIKGKSEWIYAGVYYDEGITGTSYAHTKFWQMQRNAPIRIRAIRSTTLTARLCIQ